MQKINLYIVGGVQDRMKVGALRTEVDISNKKIGLVGWAPVFTNPESAARYAENRLPVLVMQIGTDAPEPNNGSNRILNILE